MRRRYIGNWTLPSGNSADVYLERGALSCAWDRPPSTAWPRGDVDHWRRITFPAICRAVADVTGQRVLGLS